MMDITETHIRRFTDEELMTLVLEKNTRALKLLYDRYNKSIYNFILRYTNNREIAEDVLQETYTRVWFAAHTFNQKKGMFKAWLFTIGLNITRNEMTKKRYEFNYIDMDEISDDSSIASELNSQNTGNVLENIEIRDTLNRALARLNPFLREVIILKHYHELKFSEIAEITNTPEGTLKARFHNALGKLRVMLEKVEI